MEKLPEKRIDISIATATRGRIEPLQRMLDSINKNVCAPDSIEVLLGCDYDDPCLLNIIAMAASYRFEVRVLVQRRSPNICHDYVNRLFSMARGYWLMIMNDDAEIVTKDFDVAIRASTVPHMYPPWPVYLDTKDNTRNFNNNGEFACFPVINRPAFNAMGYFFPPDIPTWGADRWLYNVCSMAKIVKQCFEVEIFHHMNLNDESHENIKRQAQRYGTQGDPDIGEVVSRLVRYQC